MKKFEKGQGATEYLLMLAAVLVIVAIAVYYITTAAPTAMIAGTAVLETGDNTDVIFTPSTAMVPDTIASGDWEWEIREDATVLGSGTGAVALERGKSVELDTGTQMDGGEKVFIKYKDAWHEAATVA